MELTTLLSLARTSNLPALLRLPGLMTPFYRIAFLCGATRSGILRHLSREALSVDELARQIGVPEERSHALSIWLDIGAQLGELERRDGRYRIASRWTELLSSVRFAALSGVIEEVALFHHRVLIDGPALLCSGGALTLDDQDGEVIARSSRILQPFVEEAIRWVLPRNRAISVLDVGCGLGHQLCYTAELNPEATLTGLEVQADVADAAKLHTQSSRHSERITVQCADLCGLEEQARYDLVMLHNNIYYFDPAARVAALASVRRRLRTGGEVLVTSSCQRGPVGLEVLNFWWSLAKPGGPLPGVDELITQLRAAGFSRVRRKKLVPGSTLYAFRGVAN